MDEAAVTRQREAEHGRGRHADTPREIPAKGWKDIAVRLFGAISRDRLMLIAAGITFYLVLALFPGLATFVSLYGIFTDPASLSDHLSYIEGFVPASGMELIQAQLTELVTQDPASLSIGFLISFAIAFWSANNGMKAMFEGMNVAYNESEKRGFIRLTLISFLFTLGAMAMAVLLIAVIGIIPAVLALVNLGDSADLLVRVGRWVLMVGAVLMAISLIYRFGPSRENAAWRWVTWGSALATLVWLIASFGFSFYLQNFADYNATYGSLGAAVGFMMWIWISVLIVLIGAELNSEMEHQTARDTTTGRPRPMGERGAVVADRLGESAEAPERG